MSSGGAPKLAVALARAVTTGAIISDPELTTSYRKDQAGWTPAGSPAVVVLAETLADVVGTVMVAKEFKVPVVPRAAASGLSGGANAIDGCIVLSLSRMTNIKTIDTDNQMAVVEPGVINADLSRAVRDRGLWYPPDPASHEFSSIGGNIATNAGGLCCVKYGVTRDYVLGLEVVLANGTVARLGRRTVKGVAGYDLVGLLVGSEGTLGVITEATLRLRPPPPPPVTVAAFFPSFASVGEALRLMTAQGILPSLIELMDDTTIAAVDTWKRMDLDRSAKSLLIVQGDERDSHSERLSSVIRAACDRAGAVFVVHTNDPEEGEQLLAARRLAYPALERIGSTILDDVAVPRVKIPQLLQNIEEISARHEVLIGTFGHIGDGNMHPTIVFNRGDPDEVRRAEAAFADILETTLQLGGTITGEHGVGLLKRDYLARELSPAALSLHRSVKNAFDPYNLLNPGKVIN